MFSINRKKKKNVHHLSPTNVIARSSATINFESLYPQPFHLSNFCRSRGTTLFTFRSFICLIQFSLILQVQIEAQEMKKKKTKYNLLLMFLFYFWGIFVVRIFFFLYCLFVYYFVFTPNDDDGITYLPCL